jgi:hypothetical protein
MRRVEGELGSFAEGGDFLIIGEGGGDAECL